MIYIASSWKNPIHIAVVAACQAAGLDVYDFRHPRPNDTGFAWQQVGMTDPCTIDAYLKGIEHPIALAGFASDFEAMRESDTFVLVLPCGRSAHLELGWAVGQGKRTAILLEEEVTPELMYRMVDYLAPSLFDLLGWLGVGD